MAKAFHFLEKPIFLLIFCTIAGFSQAQNCTTYDTIYQTSCDVYFAPSGMQYNNSGTFNDTITNVAGCDSVITITLEVFYSTSVTIYAFTCGNPYWSDAGNNYCCTGSYVENHTTENGCDSTVYIELEIAEASDIELTINACDEYTSDGGIVYNTFGVHHETYMASNGCDSTIQFIIAITEIDSTAVWLGPMAIEANESGASYQWVDCNNNNAIIPGATGKIFVASVNGDYACVVEKNGCTKTTNCVRVQSLDIGQVTTFSKIYPNPSTGLFFLELSSIEAVYTVEIMNVAGQVVYQSNLNKKVTLVDIGSIEPGVYFMSVLGSETTSVKTILIE